MLRLLTFGGLSLVDDGAPVTGAASQRSRLALLAILAAAGPAGVSRDKLLACLWPESDDERARHALKQAVYALRRDLGNENAIAGTATLTLDPSIVTSDIREFEDSLARGDDAAAVAAYNGPFLDGVFVRGAAEFDQWAASERMRLERAHLDAIGRLARAADAGSDPAASVFWWRKAAAAEPLSGRVALSLMRALANSGDVSAAIQHARVHEALVRAELDSPADDAVLAFAEQLRKGEWAAPQRVTPPAPAVASVAVPVTEPTPPSVVATPGEIVVPAPPKPVRRPFALLGVVAIALVVAAATYFRNAIFGSTPPVKSNRLIVVSTFSNRTGDKFFDYAGLLAADFVVRRLIESKFEVVDPTTSNTLLRDVIATAKPITAHDSAASLAEQTGAARVVTGSVYRQGDTLLFQADIRDPVKRLILRSVDPVAGRPQDAKRLVGELAEKIAVAMAAFADTTPGSSTASLITPPSVEAYMHSVRGWEMFFERPADTTAVFDELKRALVLDTSYTTPRLMRAYILDVKERWPDLAREVAQLEPRRKQMGRVELAALALYDADLKGDLVGRLRASRELLRLSPGSGDMSLLVAISSSYLHRFSEVLDILSKTNPNQGINVLTPMYWAWRAEAEHTLGRFKEELASAAEMSRRFPNQLYGAQARARALGALGDTAALNVHLAALGLSASRLTPDARTVALLGARELRAHGHEAPAATLFRRVAAIAPTSDSRDQQFKHALALFEVGDLANARSAFAALASSDRTDLDALGRYGAVALRTGDSATFRSIERLVTDWKLPYTLGRNTYWRAHFAALSGRGGEAVALLHQAMAEGYRAMDLNIVTLHEEPDFRSIWGHPEFKVLINRPADAVLSP